MKSSKQYEEILNNVYQQFIQLEIACFRSDIEILHFLCTSFIMDILQKYVDEARKKKDENEEMAARIELRNFIEYLVKYILYYNQIRSKDGYLCQKIRQEMLQLQKKKGDEDYLRAYAQFYRFWPVQVTSKTYEKISYIKEHLCQISSIFQDFKNKIKQSNLPNQQDTLYRNGTISGLFYYNSLIQEKKVSYQRTKMNDLELIDDQAKNRDKYFNTFLDDEWLYMIAQIERLTKGQLEAVISMSDLMNSQNAVYTKSLPYQLAKQSKDAISKHNQSNKPRNEQLDPSIIPNKTYWELTKLKVHHDTCMIQHLLDPKNTLIGAKIADISNNLSCLVIGKFANVLAAGFFDGRICIYELSENFLVEGESKVELHAKKQSNAKLIGNSSFDLCMHEGPVMSIALMYDEQYMLSVSTELTIRFTCLKSRQPLLFFRGHLQTIWDLKFAPGGYWFASASSDGTAIMWTTDQNHCVRIFGPVQNQVKHVEFVPSVEYIITAEDNRVFRIWSIEKAQCMYMNYLEASVTCMNISFTGQFLTLGCSDGQVLLYLLPNMRLLKGQIYLQRMDFHSPNSRDYIKSVAISYDEQYLMCCNSNRLGIFSISNLTKPISEDIFTNLYMSIQLIEHQKGNWYKQAIPIELIELPEQLHVAQYFPQGIGIYISK